MTDNTQGREDLLLALERTLDTYGADQTRWPDGDRVRFEALIEEDARARQLMAEAAALDCVLDLAHPAVSENHDALADRIVAAAARTPRVGEGDAPENVHILNPALRRVRTSERSAGRPAKRDWAAMALLAASLLMGVFAGLSGRADGVLSLVVGEAQAASLDDEAALALGEDINDIAGDGLW